MRLMREIITRITIRNSIRPESGDDSRPIHGDLLAAETARYSGQPGLVASDALCVQVFFLRTTLSENRSALFGIMLYSSGASTIGS
jgi:hypothetical protein